MMAKKTATTSGDRLFWGRPAQVRAARRFVVAGLALAGHPVAAVVDGDLVALLVSEVVTNAVVHSASGRMDGTLLVHYQLECDELDPKRLRLRVEVRDLGGPDHPRRCRHGLESSGRRGLEVVEVLASRWGVGRHPRGRVVWFELELALDRGDSGRPCRTAQAAPVLAAGLPRPVAPRPVAQGRGAVGSSARPRPVGCTTAFIQLAGTHGGARQADLAAVCGRAGRGMTARLLNPTRPSVPVTGASERL